MKKVKEEEEAKKKSKKDNKDKPKEKSKPALRSGLGLTPPSAPTSRKKKPYYKALPKEGSPNHLT